VISRDSIRSILANSAASGLPADIEFDTELVIDSFTLVWLKHELEEQHGVIIEPQYEDLDSFTSINGIHAYLATVAPDRVAVEENVGDR
jgi:acyl carrier protein